MFDNNFLLKKKKGWKFYSFTFFRLFSFGIIDFIKNKGPQIASSLTYYTLLAIVPILALSIGIADHLGIREYLEKGLSEYFQDQTQVLDLVLTFTDNLLRTAQSEIVSAIGGFILFLSAIQLLFNMELFFSSIWKIEEKRKIKNRFVIYLLLILLVPTFLIFSGIFKVIIMQRLQFIIESWPFFDYLNFLIKLLPYMLIWFLFTLIYFLLPKTKVKFSFALISALIAGTIYEISQWLYFYFQVGVTNYSAIYSSFAALPLFLIWLQFSWMIFLFGAQLCSLLHNIYDGKIEKLLYKASFRYKILLSLLIVNRVIKSKDDVTQLYLFEKFNIPYSLSSMLLKNLVEVKILQERKEKKYLFYEPNINPNTFRVSDCLEKLNLCGVNEIKFIKSSKLKKINTVFRRLEQEITSSKFNLLVKDLGI